MSPILIRPVREQLEHDRLIRHLITKYKRKFEVAANIGDERVAPVKLAVGTFYPDLVLTSAKKLAGLVEVESGESVNNLEAMAQWVHFSRSRVPFHLYVPVQGYDTARRLCEANQARVTEVWTYRPAVEGFDLVRMSHDPGAVGATKSGPVAKAGVEEKAKPAPAKPAPPKPAPAKAVAERKPVARPAVRAPKKPAKVAAKAGGAKAPVKARAAKGAASAKKTVTKVERTPAKAGKSTPGARRK